MNPSSAPDSTPRSDASAAASDHSSSAPSAVPKGPVAPAVAPAITPAPPHSALAQERFSRYLPACYALFFASGASGLIYEVLWTRQLIYVFGATLLAVATVLAAFMGGLALGSALGGRRADRTSAPLQLYAFLEIGVGLAALLFPFLLKALDPIFRLMYQTVGESLTVFSAVRFVLCFILLLIPTTFMGATLPALSRFVVRSGDTLGSRLGSLYAVNTTGAVVGVFTAGFVLISALGVIGTNALAIAVNLGVGLLAFWLARKLGPLRAAALASESVSQSGIAVGLQSDQTDMTDPTDRSDAPKGVAPARVSPSAHSIEPSPQLLRFVLFSYFLSGAVALAFQVVWTRSLVFSFEVMKNTTYAFSGMLTVFLIGLALGSALMTLRVDREKDPLRLYALILVLIGLSGALSYLMIHFVAAGLAPFEEMGPEGTINWVGAVANVMLKTGASIGLPTLLMGMAFPVVTRVAVSLRRGVGSDIGKLYAYNTVGAIVGSVGAGFVLIPLFGVTATLTLLASVQVIVGAALLTLHPGLKQNVRVALVVGGIAVLVIMVARISVAGLRVPLQLLAQYEHLVYYEEGPLATVSIAEDEKGFRTIYVDNVGVAGTDRVLLTDQKSLAHVPMLLVEDPKSALTVGFGSGGASFSYTTYDRLDDIHCVEICSTVLRPAPLLTDSNHGILIPDDVLTLPDGKHLDFRRVEGIGERDMDSIPLTGYRTFDPRYKIILDDARSYLHFTDRRYDIIATDCTDLRYKSNANLYDLGYFQLCRDRITDDGMVVVWMPLGGLSDDAFRCALRTFHTVFPYMSVWYYNNEPTHYILLIGTKDSQTYDYARMVERLKEEDVKKDLAELYLDDPVKLLSCFVTDERGLDGLLGKGILNTENTPFLEFESPKYGYGNVPLQRNMDHLFAAMAPATDRVVGATDEVKQRITRLQQAAPIVFAGHDQYRRYHFREACADYMRALKEGGDDRATRALLDFNELRKTVQSLGIEELKGQWLAFHLASVYSMQDRWSDAVTALAPVAAWGDNLDPSTRRTDDDVFKLQGRVQALLAYCNAAAGRTDAARRHIRRALELAPDNQVIRQLAGVIQSGGSLPDTLP